jgi:hypothetical protein
MFSQDVQGCRLSSSSEYGIAIQLNCTLTKVSQATGTNFPAMTNKRPKEISAWMKTRRTWIDVDIDDVDEFAAAWWSWWGALQPDGRMSNTNDVWLAPTDKMDWRKTRKLGKNGMPLVMVTLLWWGRASKCGEDWRTAVRDVFDSIICMPVIRKTRICLTCLNPS